MRCQFAALNPTAIAMPGIATVMICGRDLILAVSRAKNPGENGKKHVKYLLTGRASTARAAGTGRPGARRYCQVSAGG
jgi:hypothetical protein